MRSGHAAGEARRNIAANALRSAGIALVSAVAGFLALGSTVLEVQEIADAYEAQQLKGYDAMSVTAGDGPPITAARCDAAVRIDGVEAAGAQLSRQETAPAQQESTPVSLVRATPGYAAFVFPQETRPATTGVLAGRDLRTELGAQPATHLSLTAADGTGIVLAVDEVAATPARLSGANRWVLVPTAPVGTVAECLVQARPGQRDVVTSALVAWFAPTTASVTPLVPADQFERDPENELAQRRSGWAWLIAGAGICTLLAFIWRSRRRDMMLYRLLGFGRGDLRRMVAYETLTTVAAPAQWGAALAIAILHPSAPVTVRALVIDDLRFAAVLALIPSLCAWTAMSGSATEVIKGR